MPVPADAWRFLVIAASLAAPYTVAQIMAFSNHTPNLGRKGLSPLQPLLDLAPPAPTRLCALNNTMPSCPPETPAGLAAMCSVAERAWDASRHVVVPSNLRNVLFVPFNREVVQTGGQRNMAFFAMGLHDLCINVTMVQSPGPMADMYDAFHMASFAPPPLCVSNDSYARFEALASQTQKTLDDSIAAAPLQNYPVEHYAEQFRKLVDQADSTLAKEPSCDGTMLPDSKAFFPLYSAVQMFRAAEQFQVNAVFGEGGSFGKISAVGLANTGHRPMWYVQGNRGSATDAFYAYHTNVITCGNDILGARFGNFSGPQAVLNGVNTGVFTARLPGKERPALLNVGGVDALTVASFGHLQWRKNQKLIAQAMAELPDSLANIHAYLFGDVKQKSYDEQIYAEAERLNVSSRVHLMGGKHRVETTLPYVDVFVLASISEGMPLALIEAMSAAVPCLVTDIPGHRELANPGVQLFASENATDLAEHLKTWASLPIADLRALGAQNRQYVIDEGLTLGSMLQNMAKQVAG